MYLFHIAQYVQKGSNQGRFQTFLLRLFYELKGSWREGGGGLHVIFAYKCLENHE